ncbi:MULTISPECIES: hypothetical protein [unclassified Sphingobacterium]|uniref:hypothetical protein n=1 Tax=unclassified Sphingobacterium TaxID=2609468 RepID=UPI0020C4861F|nr:MULTISPECIES: hypothetical protein [unclassified Sphingobacterium]
MRVFTYILFGLIFLGININKAQCQNNFNSNGIKDQKFNLTGTILVSSPSGEILTKSENIRSISYLSLIKLDKNEGYLISIKNSKLNIDDVFNVKITEKVADLTNHFDGIKDTFAYSGILTNIEKNSESYGFMASFTSKDESKFNLFTIIISHNNYNEVISFLR